jgi:hypothetical protein
VTHCAHNQVLRRRDKMDRVGFISEKHNQTRAEAMLKLEVRERQKQPNGSAVLC